jgi:hypothetical protein
MVVLALAVEWEWIWVVDLDIITITMVDQGLAVVLDLAVEALGVMEVASEDQVEVVALDITEVVLEDPAAVALVVLVADTAEVPVDGKLYHL